MTTPLRPCMAALLLLGALAAEEPAPPAATTPTATTPAATPDLVQRASVAALDQQVTTLNASVSAVDQQITTLHAGVAAVDQQVTTLNASVSAVDQKLTRLAERATPEELLRAHLTALEIKIDRLANAGGSSPTLGRGAYRGGSSLRIDAGPESLLERLRRLERELAESKAAVAARDRRLDDLRGQGAELARDRQALAERADGLAYTRDALVTAQAHIAEQKQQLAEVQARAGASELQRLKAEREFYQLAATVLRLQPGQTVELADLQEQVRQKARDLAPAETGKEKP